MAQLFYPVSGVYYEEGTDGREGHGNAVRNQFGIVGALCEEQCSVVDIMMPGALRSR